MKKSEYFAIPGLVCLAVFWRAPFVWFRTDDFAWLGLRLEVHSFSSLMRALFYPEAQGTVRVLSERLPFLVFSTVFGLRAQPFRWLGLLTWIAALGLAAALGTRITGSRVAGIAAAVVWTCSYAVAVSLMWSYNQALCGFLLLAALYGRARWLESGERKWRVAEWGAYLAGFGALEVTVMYPIAALLYTWWVAKKRDRAAWALLIPAIAFGALHLAISRPAGDVYRVAVDGRLPSTAMTYFANALGPGGYPGRWIVGAALGVFLIWMSLRRDWAVLFPAAWFVLFLAPMLPLPNHILNHYLTIPLTGMAWLAGWALERAWARGGFVRAIGIGVTAVFLAGSLPQINVETADWLRRTSRMRLVVRAAQRAAAQHPGTALIFTGVDQELYDMGFADEPFRLFGVKRVYLEPAQISETDAASMVERGQAAVVAAP